eukprot:gene20469-24562_t
MDEIDAQTWVLEPENPSRAANTRRIALGSNCSLWVEFEASSPRQFPHCQFMGSEAAVEPLRRNLNANLSEWHIQDGFIVNFERLLGVKFPKRTNSKADEFIIECAVCYSHRLDGQGGIPDIICNNSKCSKQFHSNCLFQWLRDLPNVNFSFNTLFGTCPYCRDPISVKGAPKNI